MQVPVFGFREAAHEFKELQTTTINLFSTSAISRLEHQHETLQELVTGFSEEQLKQVIQPGKWTIFQQVAHLAAYQETFLERLYTMERENNPSFDRYVGDYDPVFLDYCQKSLPAFLYELTSRRTVIIHYLTGLSEEALHRTGGHPAFGVMTVAAWTEFFLLHESHHLFCIFKLARQLQAMLQQG
jgi:hypothetical protein